ncbi:sigma-70 family RNA polymerase sigma factor [Kordiimonas marina]|uniref:sigma-70 family RNA polymerase sigma factor n=1 Tax=Kordiimonas marina TaxID=2872312 RepID=UPI001FF21940|nr:sigma-70 family RNA polymerase sigma factor [Kordiimonas marina]MCJ9429351.1 sigma-70 family RNA polymerase sigma factor [Kordiimonas marina]
MMAGPAWADHPITRALEALYQPGPTNPVQIIADSIQPRGLREGQAYQEWFPLKTPPFAPPSYEPQREEAPIREERPEPVSEIAPEIAPEISPEISPEIAPEVMPGYTPETGLHDTFWQVWSGHQEFLLKQCIRLMSGNMADAEDALSNAMLRASRKFVSYSDSIVNERAWLSRLVHNVCIDHYRRQRRTEYRDPHEDAGADIVSTMFAEAQLTPEEIALEREQVRALDVEIGHLSDQLREPLLMRFVEGLSYPEIAERLNLRADTVRKRIQLARDHLKRADIR